MGFGVSVRKVRHSETRYIDRLLWTFQFRLVLYRVSYSHYRLIPDAVKSFFHFFSTELRKVVENQGAMLKIRAERKAGEKIEEIGVKAGKPQLSHDVTITPTLKDLKITGMQSSDLLQFSATAESRPRATIQGHRFGI